MTLGEEAKKKKAKQMIETIDKIKMQGDDLDYIQNEDVYGNHDYNNSVIEEITFLGDDESTFFNNIKGANVDKLSKTVD